MSLPGHEITILTNNESLEKSGLSYFAEKELKSYGYQNTIN